MPAPLFLSGVVIIFAFLDLGKNISFSDSLIDINITIFGRIHYE